MVEDDPQICRIFELAIRYLDAAATVYTASDGAQAIALLDAHPMTLLITDFNLPTLSGIEVTRHAKRIDPSIYVIFVTAFHGAALAREARRVNVDMFLEKPVDMTTLNMVLRQALHLP